MNIENLSEILATISPQLADSLSVFLTILKAVGVAFIIYVIYLVIKLFFSLKTMRRIKRIEDKVNLIERKLNKTKKEKK